MGEMQEPDVLDEEFDQDDGEGDAAPESLSAPAQTGDGEEGEDTGEGEGSEQQAGGWSKETAALTRAQQERADALKEVEVAKREALVAQAEAELLRRQVRPSEQRTDAPRAQTDEQRQAAAALNSILKGELGMDMSELKSTLGSLRGGVGNAAIASQDVRMSSDPDSYPHYAELRPKLMAYAKEAGNLTPEAFRFAYSELERPLLANERKALKAGRAQARSSKRTAINSAPLPGGGRGTSGGSRKLTKNDIPNMGDDELADYIESIEIEDSGQFS